MGTTKTTKKPTQPKAPTKQLSKGNENAKPHEEGTEKENQTKETTKETAQEVTNKAIVAQFKKDIFEEKTEEVVGDGSGEKLPEADGIEKVGEVKISVVEVTSATGSSFPEATQPTTEKELLDSIEFPDVTHDTSVEKDKPKPNKKTIQLESGGTTTETKWECPKCKGSCTIGQAQKWTCDNNNCDYGKPKPLAEVPKEITRYKVTIPQLGIGVQNVKMVHVGGDEYVIAEGQEEYIAKQALKKLKNKQLKKMTRPQIEYMLKHGAFDEPRKRN